MTDHVNPAMTDICSRIADQRLPRWADLPDFDLYMDQVLALVTKYLGEYPGQDDKPLTAAMVNNYVKLGVMSAPVRKKYARTHLAQLIVICILKSVLPIASLRDMIRGEDQADNGEAFYNHFCGLYEQINASVAEAASCTPAQGAEAEDILKQTMYCAALRAQAERAVAAQTLSLLYPPVTEAERNKIKNEVTPKN